MVYFSARDLLLALAEDVGINDTCCGAYNAAVCVIVKVDIVGAVRCITVWAVVVIRIVGRSYGGPDGRLCTTLRL